MRVGVVLLAKEVVHRVADLKGNGPLRRVVDLYLVKREALPLEGVLAADEKAGPFALHMFSVWPAER